MNKFDLTIGFLGAGSVGSLFGGFLAATKSYKGIIKIILFCRSNHANAINKNGLIIESEEEIRKVKNIRAYESPENFIKTSEKNIDFLFLTTKCYDIRNNYSLTKYFDITIAIDINIDLIAIIIFLLEIIILFITIIITITTITVVV